MTQSAQQLFDVLQVAGDDPVVPHFSVASRLGDGNGNVFGMDIKAQIEYLLFHVVCWFSVITWFVRQRLNTAPRTCG